LSSAAVLVARTGDQPAARRWSLAILLLVACQLGLGFGAWVVNWGFPSGWLPASWIFSDPLLARSFWGATVVTGHVVLGMMILGASVVLAIAAGALAPSPATPAAVQHADHAGERAFA
jgi:hypothetical protein